MHLLFFLYILEGGSPLMQSNRHSRNQNSFICNVGIELSIYMFR